MVMISLKIPIFGYIQIKVTWYNACAKSEGKKKLHLGPRKCYYCMPNMVVAAVAIPQKF